MFCDVIEQRPHPEKPRGRGFLSAWPRHDSSCNAWPGTGAPRIGKRMCPSGPGESPGASRIPDPMPHRRIPASGTRRGRLSEERPSSLASSPRGSDANGSVHSIHCMPKLRLSRPRVTTDGRAGALMGARARKGGPGSGKHARTVRGGSFTLAAKAVRSANRGLYTPAQIPSTTGFRLVRTYR